MPFARSEKTGDVACASREIYVQPCATPRRHTYLREPNTLTYSGAHALHNGLFASEPGRELRCRIAVALGFKQFVVRKNTCQEGGAFDAGSKTL